MKWRYLQFLEKLYPITAFSQAFFLRMQKPSNFLQKTLVIWFSPKPLVRNVLSFLTKKNNKGLWNLEKISGKNKKPQNYNLAHWKVHFLRKLLKLHRPSQANENLLQSVSPFIFLLFERNLQNRTRLKGSPFNFFGTMTLFPKNFYMSLKCPPSFFWYFATEWMLKKTKGFLLF